MNDYGDESAHFVIVSELRSFVEKNLRRSTKKVRVLNILNNGTPETIVRDVLIQSLLGGKKQTTPKAKAPRRKRKAPVPKRKPSSRSSSRKTRASRTSKSPKPTRRISKRKVVKTKRVVRKRSAPKKLLTKRKQPWKRITRSVSKKLKKE